MNYSDIINKGDIFKVVMAEKAAIRPPESAIKGPGERHYVTLIYVFHRSRQKSFFVLPTQYLVKSAGLLLTKIDRSY